MNSFIFSWGRVDDFPRGTSLERRLASLEVASVVLGSDKCEDDEVCEHTSHEDALDQRVVWRVLYALCCFNSRTGVLSDS